MDPVLVTTCMLAHRPGDRVWCSELVLMVNCMRAGGVCAALGYCLLHFLISTCTCSGSLSGGGVKDFAGLRLDSRYAPMTAVSASGCNATLRRGLSFC